MKRIALLLTVLLYLYSCTSSYNFSLRKDTFPYIYFIKDPNTKDSIITWIPIKYKISNNSQFNKHFFLIRLGDNERIFTNMEDYLLFNNDSLNTIYDDSKLIEKSEFVLVTQRVKFNKNILTDKKINNLLSRNLNSLIKVDKSKYNIDSILKSETYLKTDSIYIRIVNSKGKTVKILSEKIIYN